MKKNYVLSALMLASICVPLCGCNNNSTDPVKLFYAYTTENLLSDWDYHDVSDPYIKEENKQYLNRDYTMRFSCLKGEHEGAQLMVHANKFISNFDFEVEDLYKGDTKLSKDNFETLVAWYLDVSGSNESEAYTGLYPDALIPITNYKWRRMNSIEKGRNQAIYFDLNTPLNAEAGTYKGKGKLKIDGQVIEVPFEVNIYDGVMPEEVHAASSFLIWYEQIPNGEKKNADPDMDMIYYNYTVDHRLTPDSFPTYMESDPETWVEYYYQLVANNPKITTYRVPHTSDLKREDVIEYLQPLIDKNIELRQQGDTTTDLFKKLYYYVDDEPNKSKYADVKRHDKCIFDTKNELASQLDLYPDLKKSFLAIRNLVTIQYNKDLVATNEEGGVQCWCPQFQHFNTPAQRENYKKRQKSNDRDGGENVWWYGCMDPQSPYPSFHLDADLLNSRLIRYMQYDYGVEGSIYWNMCYYSKYSAGQEISIDIWNDPLTWLNCAGDGRLVYPGVDFGIKGPISTLRLESIRASQEEYEYLWLIEQFVKKYDQEHSSSHDTNALLQKYFSKIYKNMISTDSDEDFDMVRCALLKLVEEFNHNLSVGMAHLLREEL